MLLGRYNPHALKFIFSWGCLAFMLTFAILGIRPSFCCDGNMIEALQFYDVSIQGGVPVACVRGGPCSMALPFQYCNFFGNSNYLL